jgi:hypothetical protein
MRMYAKVMGKNKFCVPFRGFPNTMLLPRIYVRVGARALRMVEPQAGGGNGRSGTRALIVMY